MDRALPQVLVQYLDAPRPGPAALAHARDEALHVELTLAAELAVLGGLDGHVGHGVRLRVAVVQLDTRAVPGRKARDLIVGNADLHDMPQVEEDAAVLRAGTLDQLARCGERVDDAEGHHLVGDLDAVVGSLLAELREALDELRHGNRTALEITDLERARAQRLGCGEELALLLIGAALVLAV